MAMNGADLLLLANVGTPTIPVYQVVGSQRDTSIDEASASIDGSNKASRAQRASPGRYSSTISLDTLHIPDDAAYLALRDANRNGNMILIAREEFGFVTATANAIINSMNISYPDQGEAANSITLTIDGFWQVIPLFDWYVDSVLGQDTNDGKAPYKPFRTIGHLLSQSIVSGERIGLAKGSHWREQFDLPANSLTVDAYGSGAQPYLDCKNISANASFTKTGGYTNIYAISVTPEWYGSGQDGFNAWEDGLIMPRAASLAALDAAPGSCFISGVSGAITFSIHASDSSSVISNGKVYEYSHRKMGLYFRNRTNCTISNIHTGGNLYSGGSLVGGPGSLLQNCTFSDGNAHNVLIEDGLVDTCLFDESYIATGSNAMLVFNKDVCAGETCTVRDSIFQNVNTATLPLNAIYGHHNTSGNYGAATISGCMFTGNIKLCVSFAYMASMTVSDCDSTGITASGPSFARPNFATATYTLTGNDGKSLDGTYVSIEDAVTITMSGNIIELGNTGAAAIYCAQTGVDLTLIDNTINPIAGISGNRIAIYFTQAANTITSTGNRYLIGAGSHYCYFAPNGINTFSSDYNTFVANTLHRWTGSINYNGLAAWQAGVSQDAHSTE